MSKKQLFLLIGENAVFSGREWPLRLRHRGDARLIKFAVWRSQNQPYLGGKKGQ